MLHILLAQHSISMTGSQACVTLTMVGVVGVTLTMRMCGSVSDPEVLAEIDMISIIKQCQCLRSYILSLIP